MWFACRSSPNFTVTRVRSWRGSAPLALAGACVDDVTAADLYSCFPAAVQSFALDLGLEGVCPYTVTGSMAFAGGPYNHGGLDGVARMVEVLREGRRR